MKSRKKITILAVVLAIAVATLVLGQSKRNKAIEAEIIAQERLAFEAWKNKDPKPLQSSMLAESLSVFPAGIATKDQHIKLSTDPSCIVKNYTLDNIKVTMLNNTTALMIYRYTQDTVCNGKPEPSPVWASTVYLKRGKKWYGAFHQETIAMQAQ